MTSPSRKPNFHPRNRFRDGYDFDRLIKATPKLAPLVSRSPRGDSTIDFSDPEAVKALNQALLKTVYGVGSWDIPPGYLCPPIPGRSDYLHYVADLLAGRRGSPIPTGPSIRVLDIGTGASCIYPLIGTAEYGWSFVGSDTDPRALRWAAKLVTDNHPSEAPIECRLQPSSREYFKGVVRAGEEFDASICNPPFHASAEEAAEATRRKRRNLGASRETENVRNFGGRSGELWCPGGELGFVLRMIGESLDVSSQCGWFTTLISKGEHLPRLHRALTDIGARRVETIEMAQGQKRSRILAWTFRG